MTWIWNLDQNWIMAFNRGCLQWAIYSKSLQGTRYAIFLSKYSKWDFQDFENVEIKHEIHLSGLLN